MGVCLYVGGGVKVQKCGIGRSRNDVGFKQPRGFNSPAALKRRADEPGPGVVVCVLVDSRVGFFHVNNGLCALRV